MTLNSRFHPINAILAPSILVLLIAVPAWMVGFISYLEVESGEADSIYKTPIYGSLLLAALAFGTIIHYLKILKKVRISEQGMQAQSLFKVEFIPWDKVSKIELMSKTNGNGFVAPIEATILKLKDGQKFELLASFYLNIGPLRKSLEQVAESLKNETPIEISPVTERPIAAPIGYLDLNRMTKFSGNPLLSLNGAFLFGCIAFTIYYLLTKNQEVGYELTLLFLILFSGLFYAFLGYQLHYFHLDRNHLVVKNHVWPWVHVVYRIDDIGQVVFESPYRRSLSMRVITEDYQSRLFPAGSLRIKTWKALLNQFQSQGVELRNETGEVLIASAKTDF